jgi:hypothetical protein
MKNLLILSLFPATLCAMEEELNRTPNTSHLSSIKNNHQRSQTPIQTDHATLKRSAAIWNVHQAYIAEQFSDLAALAKFDHDSSELTEPKK